MASMASAGLAEAYVVRKLHKEKMKKMETNEAGRGEEDAIGSSEKHSGKKEQLFSLLRKKIHPRVKPVNSGSGSV
ncbi:hypothetical protein AXF42_Ash017889 [Apostasia shenzhenica]|uniref:Uncharacterized protein n=1 Tax=Apostasia shenzhenica TaxID=1088818 RepID=A0A2I0AY53_9ASPA|nr:hypothetical protein AXF42_Ash017889 [Apostasia shenzhenica]